MKQPKKLLRVQKEILTKLGYDATEWMLDVDNVHDWFTIVHKKDHANRRVIYYHIKNEKYKKES